MSRRQYFIKTKHKRRKLPPPPPVLRKDSNSEVVAESSALSEPPPLAAKPVKSWWDYAITSGKLLAAVLVVGYGVYYLATAKPGRAVYFEQKSSVPYIMPTHPGHRGGGASQTAGAIVEHSLADRPPPTDQSFRDTFGGSRSIGPGRSGTGGASGAGGSGGAGEAGELPEKVKLREDLAGECEVGSNGRFDIEKCLRRHSVPGK